MKITSIIRALGLLALACLVAACMPAAGPAADDTADLSSNQPQLTSLYTGSTAVSLTPTFYWAVVRGAASYDLYLSTEADAGDSPLVADIAGVPYTLPAASSLSANTLYYWKVVARNAISASLPSDIQSFTTAKAPGFPAPSYASPADGSTVYPVSGFSWTAVPGAVKYRFLCSTSPDALGFIGWDLGAVTSESASGFFFEPGSTWYWKVVAEDATTCSDDSSAVWSFTPKSDGIAAPANVAISGSTISWDAVAGASKYYVLFNYGGTNFGADSLARTVAAGATSYGITTLSAGQTIGYAVVAIDASGNTSYAASVAAARTFIL